MNKIYFLYYKDLFYLLKIKRIYKNCNLNIFNLEKTFEKVFVCNSFTLIALQLKTIVRTNLVLINELFKIFQISHVSQATNTTKIVNELNYRNFYTIASMPTFAISTKRVTFLRVLN